MALTKLSQEFPVSLIEPDDIKRGENITTALSRYDNIFWKVNRYETTVERSYYRAIRELQKVQAQTRKVASQPTPEPPPEQIRSVPQNEQSTTPAPEQIRSVPQSARLRGYTADEIEMASQTLSKEAFEALLDEITAPPL
jgi:hypothetical protein